MIHYLILIRLARAIHREEELKILTIILASMVIFSAAESGPSSAPLSGMLPDVLPTLVVSTGARGVS